MRKILLSLSLLLLITSCYNDSRSFSEATKTAFKAAVDTSFAAATKKSGISVAVYKDGYLAWTYAAGTSGISTTTGTASPMTTSTPTYAYSITKTFMSALILTQIEHRLYSLDDTVEELLRNHEDYASLDFSKINKNATVAQLLKHTSGMPDYASNVPAQLAMCNPDPAYIWKPADILNNIVNKPYGATGAYEYSNTNYVLLGMIAELYGQAKLNTLLASTFFKKLNINAYLAPQDLIPSDIAHPFDDTALFGAPYGFMDLIFALTVSNSPLNFYLGAGRSTWAAGGIISTAEDLAMWGYELYDKNGSAISPHARKTLKNSAPVSGYYGYGVGYNEFTYQDGSMGRKYGHGGSAPGYKTLLKYEANQRITVAIITNANNSVSPATTDTGLGIVDREALANAIFNAYNETK